MKSILKNVFLSCSFRPEDQPIVSLVRAICEGLDMRCLNVDIGSPATPPAKARKLISDTSGLIAIASRRHAMKDGRFAMPDAVHDEILFAYGQGKPILLLKESEVLSEGFLNNLGTYLTFERASILDREFIRQLTSSIHGFKMELLRPDELVFGQDTHDFYSECTEMTVTLEKTRKDFMWKYSVLRTIHFLRDFARTIKTGAWATVPTHLQHLARPIKWTIGCPKHSKIKVESTILKATASRIEVDLHFTPQPKAGDVVEFSGNFSSKFLNPIFRDDVVEPAHLEIARRKFAVYDGHIPITATKRLVVRFRFPSRLGLKLNDLSPFVGRYTSGFNYLEPEEMRRLRIRQESLDGNIEIDLDIDEPRLGFMYGLAWNPPKRK
jgi:hypothetical protein